MTSPHSRDEAEAFRQRQLDAFDAALNGDSGPLMKEVTEWVPVITGHVRELFPLAADLLPNLERTPVVSQEYLSGLYEVASHLHNRFPKVFTRPELEGPLPTHPSAIAGDIHDLVFKMGFAIADYRAFISSEFGKA